MEIFDGIFHEGGGSRVPLRFFQKCFFKTIQNHFLTVKTGFAHSLAFILYTYIYTIITINEIEVTRNMAEYTSSWQSAAGAAEECQNLNQL